VFVCVCVCVCMCVCVCVCVCGGGYHKREFDNRNVQVDFHSFHMFRSVHCSWFFFLSIAHSSSFTPTLPWIRGGKGQIVELKEKEGV
jgi:hypothetical protein